MNWFQEPDLFYIMFQEVCLFHRWFFNVMYTISSWLVVLVTTERFIVVWFPFQVREWGLKV